MKTLLILFSSFAIATLTDLILGIVLIIIYDWKFDISNQPESSKDFGFGIIAFFGLIGLAIVFIIVFIASIFIIGNFLTNRHINKE